MVNCIFKFSHHRNITDCQDCPPGQFCDSNGLAEPSGICSRGFYCTGRAENDKQHTCEPAYHCKDGFRYECPSGTYQNDAGKWDCKTCVKGNKNEYFLNF